jgi:iron complex transport system substrate-binding protein
VQLDLFMPLREGGGMARVVSLIASSTEMITALGCADQLVGISHECDYPPEVLHLPRCTATKFATDGTSYDIDHRVKAICQEGLSVYRVDADRLRALRPDLLVTQTQCEVCAVSQRDVEAAVCETLGWEPQIVSLHPDALADIWTDIARVAAALQVAATGAQLIESLQRRMHAMADTAAGCSTRPRVAYIEWIDPLMAGGNWMPELIEQAGGENLFGEAGKHSPWMTWEELVRADPEVIVVAPCGFDIARSLGEMDVLVARPEWREIQAVRDNRVIIADGNQYFNRPGPRVVESLEILAEVIHPASFTFGHEGRGWQRFTEYDSL